MKSKVRQRKKKEYVSPFTYTNITTLIPSIEKASRLLGVTVSNSKGLNIVDYPAFTRINDEE